MGRAAIVGAVLSLLVTVTGGWAQAPEPPHDEVARLTEFFRKYLDDCFALRPLDATVLGDHRFDDQLDDVSAAARGRWTAHTRRTLDALRQTIHHDQLPRAAQVDYEILEHELLKTLWLDENTHPFEQDPRVYNNYINDSVYLLLTQSTLPREQNVAHAIARMRQIPQVVAAARANLMHPPRVHTETAIRQNRGAIAFYQTDIFNYIGDTPQRDTLRDVARDVVATLQQYQQFLEQDLLPRADGDWRLGAEKFARKLELELDAGVNAQQVKADAQAEFVRVRGEMFVIARQLWSHYFPRRPLPPDDQPGRVETIQRVLAAIGKNHGPPQQLTDDVRQTVAMIKTFITQSDILRLPDPDRCSIIEMPEFQRGNSTAFMNSPPPLDSHASGYFAVSPPPLDWDDQRVQSYLEEYNRYMLQILTIHEAYPGHYVQFEFANRNPSLIRRVLYSGAYVEGWAVYTEQMMLDQGYGDGDLALRLTQLKFYLRAVANALLDHDMHCGDITDEAALDFLTKEAFQSEGEARLKIIRAQQSSVQLSTYFVGRMAHYRLRQALARELGDRFVLSAYHHAVLNQAGVPPRYLPELVRAELAAGSAGF